MTQMVAKISCTGWHQSPNKPEALEFYGFYKIFWNTSIVDNTEIINERELLSIFVSITMRSDMQLFVYKV